MLDLFILHTVLNCAIEFSKNPKNAITMASSSTTNDNDALLRTDRMRNSTKQVHDHSTGQLKLGLILTSKPLYAETLSLFLPIYALLEQLLEKNKEHAQLGQLYPLLSEIARAPGFEKDIEYYKEKNVKSVTLPEVDDYLRYLTELEATNPVALLAWYYHMYMAIFAGGFIIKKTVKKTMRLTSDEGVQAYSFSTDPKKVRDQLKSIVNSMTLTPEQEDAILKEGPKVFLRNDSLMDNLRKGAAFRNAEADCCRFITKVTVAVVVAIAAIGLAMTQSTRLQ